MANTSLYFIHVSCKNYETDKFKFKKYHIPFFFSNLLFNLIFLARERKKDRVRPVGENMAKHLSLHDVRSSRLVQRTNKNNIGQTMKPMGWEKYATDRGGDGSPQSKVYIFD